MTAEQASEEFVGMVGVIGGNDPADDPPRPACFGLNYASGVMIDDFVWHGSVLPDSVSVYRRKFGGTSAKPLRIRRDECSGCVL